MRISPPEPASRGSLPRAHPPSESVRWTGEQGVKVIYRDADGQLGERYVYRDDEPSLELVEMGRPWSTREEARDAIGEYIEIFNNRIRRHSTIGGMSPAKFEELAQTKEVQAA